MMLSQQRSAVMDGKKFVGKPFGQERAPLSVTISQILDRYPDGQIFKVRSMSSCLSYAIIWRGILLNYYCVTLL